MNPPDKIKEELLKQWLEKAEKDLGLAKHLLKEKTIYLEAVGFHAQQAAEKYLKAFLVQHQIEFPKTHNLGKLLDLVSRIDPDLAESLREATKLNPYSIVARYPGDSPKINEKDARKAVKLAAMVREKIIETLENI
jgi:HEPN domain-containing protein